MTLPIDEQLGVRKRLDLEQVVAVAPLDHHATDVLEVNRAQVAPTITRPSRNPSFDTLDADYVAQRRPANRQEIEPKALERPSQILGLNKGPIVPVARRRGS